MELYQIIIIVVSVAVILLVSKRFRNDTLSIGTYIEWLVIWILVILAALFPQISINLASFAGLEGD